MIPVSYTMSRTSVHSSSGTLSITLKHNKINGEKQDVLTSVTEDTTGENGVMDSPHGYGVAFQFMLECDNVGYNASNWKGDFSNATIKPFEDGVTYTLKRAGAVMTNKADVGTDAKAFTLDNLDANGKTVIDVPVTYLWEDPATTPGYITHVMRVVKIPQANLSTQIYARPYYVFEYEGKEVVVYGDIVSRCYETFPDINDGWLEWD